MWHAADGSVLDAGRKTRTVPPTIRRALEYRDKHCRFPGCGSKYCDAHHIRHWARGGETKLDNLSLLCVRHHRAVHEGDVLRSLSKKKRCMVPQAQTRPRHGDRKGEPYIMEKVAVLYDA